MCSRVVCSDQLGRKVSMGVRILLLAPWAGLSRETEGSSVGNRTEDCSSITGKRFIWIGFFPVLEGA